MNEDNGNLVYVDAHTRDGYDVSAHTRSWPGSGGKLSSRVDAISDFKGEKESNNVKEALHQLGYNKEDNTVTAMIKQFQKDNGLTIDGYMEPDGESIKKLNEVVKQPRSKVFANKPYISNMTTREILEGMFEGTLPVTKINPDTGFKLQVYEEQEDEEWTDFSDPKYDSFHKGVAESDTVPYGLKTLNKINDDLPHLIKSDVVLPALMAISILNNNKKLMDRMGYIGSDNYFHRKGMYESGQQGQEVANWAYRAGLGKEAWDIYDKKIRKGQELLGILFDNYKDLKNNQEGIKSGLQNPNLDSRIWLKDLDWVKNKWKR